MIKGKEGKRQGKKTHIRRGSNPGPRRLTRLNPAKSLNLNKTDVIITLNTSKVV